MNYKSKGAQALQAITAKALTQPGAKWAPSMGWTDAPVNAVHLWGNVTRAKCEAWAKGPQTSPRPVGRTFCGLDYMAGGVYVQTPEQRNPTDGTTCPTCQERAEGHARILSMIHAGAERARREANRQA